MNREISMNRVKELRKKNGLTMQKIKDETGIGKSTISSYESGRITPKHDKAQKLAEYFGVSEAYLLGYSDSDTQKIEWDSVVDYLSNLIEFDYKKMLEIVEINKYKKV